VSRATPRGRELPETNLGDLAVVLLGGSLVGLRDRLETDGYDDAAELVAGLVDLIEDYLTTVGGRIPAPVRDEPCR
jgi:hypothetical protein